MIGERYWSTGVTVRHFTDGLGRPGWGASLTFHDGGFCSDDTDARAVATQGDLATRYFVRDGAALDGLTVALDVLTADAERLGVEFRADAGPWLYYQGDGEDPAWPPPPDWRELLTAQAARLGWQTYSAEAAP